MVREAARLRDVEIELHQVIDDQRDALARFESRPTYRARRRLVRAAETNPLAKAGLAGYRSLRGRDRNSRWT
jgi:hypothetical protein